MASVHRHQCLVYEGSPERHLPGLASAMAQMLDSDCRCLYLNNPQMVTAMQAQLADDGIDVARLMKQGALVLTSERSHLRNGHFDADAMLHGLDQALQQALDDGYKGLWATGDMTWEFGPDRDFSQLLEYEWQLEEYFETHPELGGICQYHADTLPHDAMRTGLVAHPSIFINKTLSLVNPHFLQPGSFEIHTSRLLEVEPALNRLLSAS